MIEQQGDNVNVWVQSCLFHFSEVIIKLCSFCSSDLLAHSLQNKQTKKINYQAGKSWKGEMLQMQEVEEISVILSDDVKLLNLNNIKKALSKVQAQIIKGFS